MKTTKIPVEQIIQKIKDGEQFDAIPSEGGFVIKINKYVPYCCTAIHNGTILRKELKSKISLNDYERWYEEDPHTADFIASMPITIVGLDSRFEYDLNRTPENCIYKEAWGKNVWKQNLTQNDVKISKRKHKNYYRVLEALVAKIEDLFGGCVVYDIHSYNFKRWTRDVPLFNIGTELIDKDKFGEFTDHWLNELETVKLPQIENRVAENDVFKGKGYNLEFVTEKFSNSVVLATEIKKVYCDELTGDTYPRIIRLIHQKLKTAILNNANYFSSYLSKWHYVTTPKLLDKNIDPDLIKIDKALYGYLKNFEILAIVNPVNSGTEKKKFLRNKHSELPKFRYQPIRINPYLFKQKILALEVQKIQDVSIRNLYESVINAYSDKIDLMATLNTKKFLYNSLRYFGRPSKSDLMNANYLLHLPDIEGDARKEPLYTASEAIGFFEKALEDYGIKAQVELSNKVISKILVINSKKTILFQPEAVFKRREMQALIEHEIGVHMTTTMNSSVQPLKVLNIGLPVNTLTQEGLAILAEYLSGNITLVRLKKIALRVIIVDMMCNGADFIECFDELVNEYDIDENEAFVTVTRVFRGGGFTKDYLYLNGFVQIYKLWLRNYDLTPLLIGKTSLPFLSTIEEMLGREMIKKPVYITKSFVDPQTNKNNPIYEYILSGLK